jgi:hypothetical protein
VKSPNHRLPAVPGLVLSAADARDTQSLCLRRSAAVPRRLQSPHNDCTFATLASLSTTTNPRRRSPNTNLHSIQPLKLSPRRAVLAMLAMPATHNAPACTAPADPHAAPRLCHAASQLPPPPPSISRSQIPRTRAVARCANASAPMPTPARTCARTHAARHCRCSRAGAPPQPVPASLKKPPLPVAVPSHGCTSPAASLLRCTTTLSHHCIATLSHHCIATLSHHCIATLSLTTASLAQPLNPQLRTQNPRTLAVSTRHLSRATCLAPRCFSPTTSHAPDAPQPPAAQRPDTMRRPC